MPQDSRQRQGKIVEIESQREKKIALIPRLQTLRGIHLVLDEQIQAQSYRARQRREASSGPCFKAPGRVGFVTPLGAACHTASLGRAPLAANPGKERRVSADQCSRTPQRFEKFLFRGVSVSHPLT